MWSGKRGSGTKLQDQIDVIIEGHQQASCPQWHQERDVQMLASQSPGFWSQMLHASGRMLVSKPHAFLLTHLLSFLLCSCMPMFIHSDFVAFEFTVK